MSALGLPPLDPSTLSSGPPGSAADAIGAGAAATGPGGAAAAPSFADVLGQAVGDVERLQLQGDRSAGEVALGGGNLHETALALEKADVALRVAVKVRNKIVEAYQDIMRMSV